MTSQLQILDCNKDRDEWAALVNSVRVGHDPHFSPDYYRAWGDGNLAVMRTDNGFCARPFRHQGDGWIGNAFNYGGTLFSGCGLDLPMPDIRTGVVLVFSELFGEWKEKRGLNERISIAPHYVWHHPFNIPSTPTVFVDLTNPSKIRSTTKHLVNKAAKAGVIIERKEITPLTVGIFDTIYHDVMGDKGADDHWYYPNTFFHKVLTNLGDCRSSLFFSRLDNMILGGCLLIHYENICYYHWSASTYRHPELGVNHLMVAVAAEWAKSQGMRYFHLGGGDEKLMTFKRGFSKLELPCYRYVTMAGRYD